jgi:hypothetical protein
VRVLRGGPRTHPTPPGLSLESAECVVRSCVPHLLRSGPSGHRCTNAHRRTGLRRPANRRPGAASPTERGRLGLRLPNIIREVTAGTCRNDLELSRRTRLAPLATPTRTPQQRVISHLDQPRPPNPPPHLDLLKLVAAQTGVRARRVWCTQALRRRALQPVEADDVRHHREIATGRRFPERSASAKDAAWPILPPWALTPPLGFALLDATNSLNDFGRGPIV